MARARLSAAVGVAAGALRTKDDDNMTRIVSACDG
jgi:hypothetical protein